MKNTSLLINVILAVAVIALFVIVLSDRNGSQQGSDNVNGSAAAEMGIVFVNTDSLIIKYDLARELSEEPIRKEESSRTDFNESVRVFEQDMMEFQRKLQNDGFLSLDRAQSEERRLRQKEQELQALNARLTNDLMDAQNAMNQQLRDTITNFLKDYCKEKSYSMVLSNTMGDNLLYADSVFDVTDDVVAKLNERYAAAKK